MAKKTNKSLDSIFGDESMNEQKSQDFATLLANTEAGAGKRLRKGDEVRGEILSIGKEEAFVSTGTPVDGIVLIKDLLDENKQIKYKVGDFIDLVVTQFREGEIRLSKKGATSSVQDLDSLEDAFDMELPVEGRVIEVCNGGFRVLIQGKTAFCPVSQMDMRVAQDHNEYLNQKFDFLITQFENKGKNIVVSRRRLLTLQRAENEGTFMLKHPPGTILSGKITKIERFGAFVELESGIEGLVHISELSWSRISDPHEVVSIGMPVHVKLLKIEDLDGRLKISLSLKEGGDENDPWITIREKFPLGSVWTGKVEKRETYGLFVNIAPGITGLLPKSKWKESLDSKNFEGKKRGDEVMVQIDQILVEERKISLGLPGEKDDPTWRDHVQKTGFGTFADLLKKG